MRLRNLTLCVVALLCFGARPFEARATGARRAARTGEGRTAARTASEQTLNLRVGQEISVAARKLRVRFVAVREDSRCPEGVQCIQAGNARVGLRLSRPRARAATVELNTDKLPREITYGGYTIKLTNLAPRPVADRPARPRDYVATLVVSKKS